MDESNYAFEKLIQDKALEICTGQSPYFNIAPTLEAVRHILSWAGWDIVRKPVTVSEGQE